MSFTKQLIEIRTYNLKPGSGLQFNKLFKEQALPMLQTWKVEVIAYGNSMHNIDSYFLCRAYSSLEQRQQSQNDFYGSDEWITGPRQNVLSLIEDYATLVLPIDLIYKTLSNMQTTYYTMHPVKDNDDKQTLSELNTLYIKNFVTADTEKHNKLLHKDFICIQSNGTIIDKQEYLKGLVTGYKDSGYTSFSIGEEDIRVLGNVALVRSKTTYTKQMEGGTIEGHSVYTDTYIKEKGEWVCIQAQITPVK